MQLTPEQDRAINDHARNLIVVAGAGSGKTFVLVERYLKLLDAHPDWSLNALVAITFTHKAAEEMRDRVRRALDQRRASALTDAERTIWSRRLAEMGSARIDTIHALCASLLRANAAEAGIDPDFRVLDETEAQILYEDVFDAEIRRLSDAGDPTTRLFAEYPIDAIRRGIRGLIADDIPGLPNDLMAHWTREWHTASAGVLNTLMNATDFTTLLGWQPPQGFPTVDDKIHAVWEQCWRLQAIIADTGESVINRLNALAQMRDSIKLGGGKVAAWGGKDNLSDAKDILKLIRRIIDDVYATIGEPPGTLDQQAADLLPTWVELAQRVQRAYINAKRHESAVDFDDLEVRARALLNENAAVRQRYQNSEFRHVLVDEFQDTNARQWDIVRALADPQQPGCLFVVGDAKQSIYAFRGADVSVFAHVRDLLKSLGGDAVEVPLSQSFRSHSRLIDGFNDLFAHLLTRDSHSPVERYQVELDSTMTAFRTESPDAAPALELVLVEQGTADPAGGTLSSEDNRRWEAYEIARHLRRMIVDQQRKVYDKRARTTRPLGYGDVTLLFQSMSNVTVYEDVFKAVGLPFVTVAGRGYFSQQEVWDLLNLLKALHNTMDNLALASALRSPLLCLSDDALYALRLIVNDDGFPLRLWDALKRAAAEQVVGIGADEQPLIEFAAHTLHDLRALAGRVTMSELLLTILERTGYLATLTALPDGDRRRGNVEKLLTLAQRGGKTSLGAFTRYLGDLSAREVREGEALVEATDAVRLMTVHASKGLEFPLVVLVDSSWERGNLDRDALVYDPQVGLACRVYNPATDTLDGPYSYQRAQYLNGLRLEAERKRLLYVAATRAQDYLLISGQVKWKETDDVTGWDTKGWLAWLFDALNIQQVRPDADSETVERRYDWGTVHLHFPVQPPRDFSTPTSETVSVWDSDPVRAGQLLPTDLPAPALLGRVPAQPTAPAQSLTATQIADLGSAYLLRDQGFYRQKFRRSVLHDAPSPIERVSDRPETVPAFKIGEMVHRMLQWWRFPSAGDDCDALLESYAWQQGIIDRKQRQAAVKQARALLNSIRNTDIYQAQVNAKTVYRELPFIFENDTRTIHGIIDVLFQDEDDNWHIIDYKTSYVPNGKDVSALHDHACRYHLQLGVYAAAVSRQLGGVVPCVYIHYIRYTETIEIEPDDWRSALEKLEEQIGDLLGDSST